MRVKGEIYLEKGPAHLAESTMSKTKVRRWLSINALTRFQKSRLVDDVGSKPLVSGQGQQRHMPLYIQDDGKGLLDF
jgi:hypothetical protein